METKPQTREEMIAFVNDHFKFKGGIEEDRALELKVMETDKAFIIDVYFTWKINKHQEHYRTDDFFTFIKTQPIEALEKYLNDMYKTITETPLEREPLYTEENNFKPL